MAKIKASIIVFPGSNCDHDAYHALKHIHQQDVTFIWHKDHDLQNPDLVLIPGGFSYGDYLRTGAIAQFSPIMEEVYHFAENGGTVVGICNGFQILLECGLLPGAMLHNNQLKFTCKNTYLRCDNNKTFISNTLALGQVIQLPVAHGEGNYFCDSGTLESLHANNQIIFTYCTKDGITDELSNPNGSLDNIACISNQRFNVFGMMPHPERAVELLLGNKDGSYIFDSILQSL